MALIKCKECGQKVSKKAKSCPGCGAPVARKGMGCGTLIVILFGVGFVSSIWISVFEPTGSSSPSTTSPTVSSNNQLIPYQIINRSEFMDAKVSFDVRVDYVSGKLPTKDQLAAISNALKASEKHHDRTFVVFYLPGMEVDAGGFATAHHNPNLEVRILSYNIPGVGN